jgi:hypothetical protein
MLVVNTEGDKLAVIWAINNLDISKQWEVIIRRKKSFRSLPQNKLYWLWIGCICDETGAETRVEKDDVHEFLKSRFLPEKEINLKKFNAWIYGSTKNLNTAEFKIYLDKIQLWAAEFLTLTLPNPHDKYFAEFYEKYKEFI